MFARTDCLLHADDIAGCTAARIAAMMRFRVQGSGDTDERMRGRDVWQSHDELSACEVFSG